ncbi:MAG: hypothetical protein ACO2ER_14455 [Castellaniella sp.]
MTDAPSVENILALADDFAATLSAHNPPTPVMPDTLTRAAADRQTSDRLMAAQLLDLDRLFLAFANRAATASTVQECDLYGRLALRCQYQAAVTLKALAG